MLETIITPAEMTDEELVRECDYLGRTLNTITGRDQFHQVHEQNVWGLRRIQFEKLVVVAAELKSGWETLERQAPQCRLNLERARNDSENYTAEEVTELEELLAEVEATVDVLQADFLRVKDNMEYLLEYPDLDKIVASAVATELIELRTQVMLCIQEIQNRRPSLLSMKQLVRLCRPHSADLEVYPLFDRRSTLRSTIVNDSIPPASPWIAYPRVGGRVVFMDCSTFDIHSIWLNKHGEPMGFDWSAKFPAAQDPESDAETANEFDSESDAEADGAADGDPQEARSQELLRVAIATGGVTFSEPVLVSVIKNG